MSDLYPGALPGKFITLTVAQLVLYERFYCLKLNGARCSFQSFGVLMYFSRTIVFKMGFGVLSLFSVIVFIKQRVSLHTLFM